MSQSPPKRALCVLHLEDSPEDRELVQEMFANEGVVCDFRPVETRAAFEAALEKGECELILSDYSLPGIDGMTALALAHARRPEVPFIFISGVMGEERAIESMKNGATDYVLKERIDRLLPSVRRAMREVEERRQLQLTELRLRQSEEQLRQITENVSDWILVFDLEGRCTYSNPAYQRALDVLPTPASGHFWERLAERDAAVLRAEFNELVLKGIARRLEVRLQSGSAQRYVEAQFNLVCDEKGARKSVVLVCRDITVRRMAEEQMRAQSAILDQTQDAIIICNSEENIVYWNPSAMQLYGWSTDEVRGRNLHALLHPTPQPPLAEAKRIVQREGEWHGELRQLSKENNTLVVQSRWTLFRDEAGRAQSLLMVNTDARNLQFNEVQLLRAQQTASLATLAEVMARDLRATLEPVLLAAELLRVRARADAGRGVDDADANPQRISALLQQTEQLARPARGERMEVLLGPMIEELGRQLRQAFSAKIEVKTSVPEDLWAVAGDHDALRQAIMNLCINAREAMPDSGRLEIIAENLVLRDADPRLRHDGRPGMHVVITVADTGRGITATQLEEVFRPFFTTKEQGRPVGVGLTAVHAITRAHGGFVTVDSELQRGSRFRIHLPAASGNPTGEKPQPRRSYPRGDGEFILLVDDEAGFREITQVTLEKYGYRVVTACDGSEAMTLYMRHRQEIQLVLTDIVMPVMDGAALIRSLHKMGAPVRYLAVSGLIEREKVMVATAAPGVHVDFLAKPFATEKLLTTVRDALQRPLPAVG